MSTERRLLKIPRKFIDDHSARELPTPIEVEPITDRATHIWSDDVALPELIDDAEFYCDPNGPGAGYRDYLPLRNAARGLLRALQRQGAYRGNFLHGTCGSHAWVVRRRP